MVIIILLMPSYADNTEVSFDSLFRFSLEVFNKLDNYLFIYKFKPISFQSIFLGVRFGEHHNNFSL